MISNLRNFAKTGIAKILMVIIIIPFVFWGMGGVFSSGSTNSIAKINNYNISTQDLVDHLNEARLDLETIKQNIDNNVLEELLGNLVSNTLIQMEIEDLNIYISEKILIEKIKKNKAFLDNQNKFSRTKYEKFLLLNNMTAPDFEIKLKKSELQKNLFSYISGGIKSPFFITNNTFKEQTKKLDIKFINLINVYKKKESFSNDEIQSYINENSCLQCSGSSRPRSRQQCASGRASARLKRVQTGTPRKIMIASGEKLKPTATSSSRAS